MAKISDTTEVSNEEEKLTSNVEMEAIPICTEYMDFIRTLKVDESIGKNTITWIKFR